MDLNKAIRALYDERNRLDKLIDSLERVKARGEHLRNPAVHARRGRKKMNPAERQEVSQRMKRYWAARRAQTAASAPGSAVVTPVPEV